MDVSRKQQITEASRDIGALIKKGRLHRGLSQEALAAAIGLTFQQVQKYEKGVNRVSTPMILAIADALSMDIGFFLPVGKAPIGRSELSAIHLDIGNAILSIDRLIAELGDLRQRFTTTEQRISKSMPA